MNEIYINGNLVVTEVGSSVTPQAEYVQDAWAIAGEPIQLGGDDITLSYRTPNVQPVKPDKAGYYWYKEGRTWRVAEVTEDGHFTFVRVWLQDQSVEVVYHKVDLASGEWGARIVHAD